LFWGYVEDPPRLTQFGVVCSQADRAVLGRKCKRIIDAGRVDFLRSLGLEAKLVHYCDVEESVENCLLLAWTPLAPRSA
jgi:hypothetical protein